MSSIQINNETFNYELNGPENTPVLFLSNSLGTTHSMWAKQVDYFSKNFRVLSYDTRGHGESVKNKGPYTLEQLGNDVLQITQALGIEKFSFCGISMGGLIGQWLGIHAPEKLDKLVVCNTAAKIGQEAGWNDRAALVRSEGMNPVADGSAGRWFTEGFVQANPASVNALINGLRQTDAEGYASCCDALAKADLREKIALIKTPTLIVAGSHDPVTTVADADAMAEKIAGSKRVDLDASHLSNIEASEAFNRALEDFLKR
ncbi:3-oxoadipate enol-lactonase [Advenella alkanexedens]|uniref:3-oxoadipate enol-lactonase n=1 Tax=Advenella alkanexedens TaxID=1481665 RepID=UPI00267460A9|nr:3-oxoadipate enol-lactonase [Advenella alkanexedens]WKU20301.1 3-oxoadipate enol-lactonase [Advenella alkanexedens]